jgi:alpha-beta hydrolase superfamily lysophospholipase
MTDKTQFLEISGGRIAYDDSGGSGLLVIAAPGMGDTRGVYQHLSPLLTGDGLRLVTFDLRGLGESSVEWDDYSDVIFHTLLDNILVILSNSSMLHKGFFPY